MNDEMKRVEIGFGGGQVMSSRLESRHLEACGRRSPPPTSWRAKRLVRARVRGRHDLARPRVRWCSSASPPPPTRSASPTREEAGRVSAPSRWAAVALWWRKNPSACPYSQRFWVEAPHPLITRDRLREILEPQPGERVLEIGPGTGYYTLDLAEWVGDDGAIEIFDIQQEMLDHTIRRARERGLGNVNPTRGDAQSLDWEDDASMPRS